MACYVDADWGGDLNDIKSVSGYLLKIFGNTVLWVTRKQNCVSVKHRSRAYRNVYILKDR